jgi:hypothetical protein
MALPLRRLAAAGLIAFCVTGCGISPAVAQPGAAVPKDWRHVDAGSFSFMAPPSLQKQGGQAIDSQAGQLSNDTLTLHYDYGLYSDPLSARAEVRDHRSRTGVLDGFEAQFVSFTYLPDPQGKVPPKPYCEGVHVPLVKRSLIGALRLTLLACSKEPAGLAIAPQLFASVKFSADAKR